MDLLQFRDMLKNSIENMEVDALRNEVDKIYYRGLGRKEGMESALILLDGYINTSLDNMYLALHEDPTTL